MLPSFCSCYFNDNHSDRGAIESQRSFGLHFGWGYLVCILDGVTFKGQYFMYSWQLQKVSCKALAPFNNEKWKAQRNQRFPSVRKNQGLDRLHRETSRHSAFTEEASTQWGRLFSDHQVKKKTLHTDDTSREAVVCIRGRHRVMDRHSCLLPRNGITSSFCCCPSPLVL